MMNMMISVTQFVSSQDGVSLTIEAALLVAAAATLFLFASRLRRQKAYEINDRAWRTRIDLRKRGA